MKFYDLVNEEEKNDIEFGGLLPGDVSVKKASGLRGGTPAGQQEYERIMKENPTWYATLKEVKAAINTNKEAKEAFSKIDDTPDLPFRINARTGNIQLTDDHGNKWMFSTSTKKLGRI